MNLQKASICTSLSNQLLDELKRITMNGVPFHKLKTEDHIDSWIANSKGKRHSTRIDVHPVRKQSFDNIRLVVKYSYKYETVHWSYHLTISVMFVFSADCDSAWSKVSQTA